MIEKVLTFLIYLLELYRNRDSAKLFGATRSPQWRKVRAEHLKGHPTCALCGGSETIEVHHILPFHEHPELELEPTNLITLCESGKNGIVCHRGFGHLGNYRSFNENVREDAQEWALKIADRP